MVSPPEHSLRLDRLALHVALLARLGSQMGRHSLQQHPAVPHEFGTTLSGRGFLAE